jgi:hypothetical protein
LSAALSLVACAPPPPPTPDAEAPLDVVRMDAAAPDAIEREAGPRALDADLPEVAQTPLPDFSLVDQNPRSSTANMAVSLNAQRGSVSAWYFATSSCEFCVQMVTQLDRLQREITATSPRRPVKLFVIADLDSDGATSVFAVGNSLPVLQDNREAHVQANWMAAIRDVVVVDDEGTRRFVYNLNTRPLNERAFFDDLKARLLLVANR